MYEILKDFAAAESWLFDYGRSDFHNLFNESEQKDNTHLFLDPVEVEKNRNDSGGIESITYSGNFMALYSSSIDEVSYEDRYEKYIRLILVKVIEAIEEHLICSNEASLDVWKTIEVVNVFDYNFDGILVTYRVTIND